jgi:hypothetical protein
MSDKDLLQQITSSPLLQRRLEQLLLSGALSSDGIANSALIPLASPPAATPVYFDSLLSYPDFPQTMRVEDTFQDSCDVLMPLLHRQLQSTHFQTRAARFRVSISFPRRHIFEDQEKNLYIRLSANACVLHNKFYDSLDPLCQLFNSASASIFERKYREHCKDSCWDPSGQHCKVHFEKLSIQPPLKFTYNREKQQLTVAAIRCMHTFDGKMETIIKQTFAIKQ